MGETRKEKEKNQRRRKKDVDHGKRVSFESYQVKSETKLNGWTVGGGEQTLKESVRKGKCDDLTRVIFLAQVAAYGTPRTKRVEREEPGELSRRKGGGRGKNPQQKIEEPGFAT